MIRTSRKWITFLSVILGLYNISNAQTTVQIVYENGKFNASKTSLTFDVRAIRGQNYDTAIPDSSNWQYMNLRSDIELPVGIIISSTNYIFNSTYSSGGALSKNPPPNQNPKPGNWAGFSFNLTRTSQNDIPAGDEGIVLGTGTMNFSGSVPPTAKVTVRPFDGTSYTAFWTNLELTIQRKRIVGTADVALPVKLIDFSTAREGDKATLAWSTSEESNSDYLEVQRSGDGKNWEKLISVPAKGESSVEAHYSAVDESPMGGRNYYRLKMIDKDGTFALSKIRDVEFDLKAGYTLFPNPVSDKLNFKSAADWQSVSNIKIYNAQGVEVYTSPSVPVKEVSVKNLPSGTYVVKLSRRSGQSNGYQIVISR
ncbi:Por secretion system C-terminal sorting domain-containing protein [Dyadobacter sp. SG02]|uniref:T9SS type A sorting domain-containing protein n=1 Tax=Dyadobacter sp. SG02 TaxID=1855291 RepID=UPI0008B431D0|nr:T9SS type A sorting domain-containing protein [Dyadobacter sp. SG02]SEJ81746.1 Por secretion system C-terminal sorting domain-containing protein [Dyadobacter sp. SG02]